MYFVVKIEDMNYFIGREQEIQLLERIYADDRSAFVALYGRRRIGKTEFVDAVWLKTKCLLG